MISNIQKSYGHIVWKERSIGFLSLFISTGTLLCCALPAAVSILAGGAAITALTSSFPWLIPLSRNKDWIFLAAGIMIVLNGILLFRSKKNVSCETSGGNVCAVSGRFTKVTFWISAVIILVGAFFAYGIVPILRWLEAGQ